MLIMESPENLSGTSASMKRGFNCFLPNLFFRISNLYFGLTITSTVFFCFFENLYLYVIDNYDSTFFFFFF